MRAKILSINQYPKFVVDKESMAIEMTLITKTAMKFLEKKGIW